jgi:uncharacterized protein
MDATVSTLRCTAFDGHRLVQSGTYLQVALAVKALLEHGAEASVLIFDDDTGAQIDFDLRGTGQEISGRLAERESQQHERLTRGPGRPKLGVVPREVTLLPRHWEWLSKQPGGASVALRKLVEEARRTNAGNDNARASQERAYRFISAIAGDLPGFEEAARALFANDREQLNKAAAGWPADLRDHAIKLAFKARGA